MLVPIQLVSKKITSKSQFLSQRIKMTSTLLFRQLFDRDTCTYTYLLADSVLKEAILIDPVIEQAERDRTIIRELGLKLKYAVNTHMHADHITGTGLLKKLLPQTKSVISQDSTAKADIYIKHGSVLKFGEHALEIRSTPGHTNGCVTYVLHANRMAFTGDALLIRGCGRTDFQEGDPGVLYESNWKQILSLPDDYNLWPAHDYKGRTVTTVREEKLYNPRLTKSKDEFIELMNNLGLPYPKRIDQSLPANRECGLYDLPEHLQQLI